MKLFVILVAVGYSLLRYAWAKQIPAVNWPAFISNKAAAFCAVSFFVLGFYKCIKDKEQANQFFYLALVSAITHGVMSVALLNPVYFQYLYAISGKLNIFGEMTVFFGALTLALFLTTSRESSSFKRNIVVFVAILCHVVSVGVLKWIDPGRWQYGLIPISLLSCVIVITGMVIFIKQHSSSTGGGTE